MSKQMYIELMDLVLSAYKEEKIRTYIREVEEKGIWEHGFARLTANIGILIAHGKRNEYKEVFHQMMDICCREIPTALFRNGNQVGNDFSVKEIIFCLLEVEKSRVFAEEVTQGWRASLSLLIPHEVYSVIAPMPPVRIMNWAAFGAASEQLRIFAGLGNERGFVENQVKSQLFSFDENGMYRDYPDEAIVYDFVTRLQLAIALRFGYDGESREILEKNLMKASEITLEMQSVTGEIPFGGRSSQFLHNETMYAALFEFYAGFYKAKGDLKKAGEFKCAARLAIEAVIPWLQEEKIRHIKNYYDCESMYGCEKYAYFDKYMITAGSMLYFAYVMADDTIAEVDCPAINKNYICETSPYFHKVMCKYKDYFVEIDTKADEHYDSSGIGRIHKRKVPSALMLSVPFSKKPNYMIDIENPSCLSVCAGIKTEDGIELTCGSGTEYKLMEKCVGENTVKVTFECKTSNGLALYETIILSEDGVEIHAEGKGEVVIVFPVFFFDGEIYTQIEVSQNNISICYHDYTCIYFSNGVICDEGGIYANRNGHYKAFTTRDTERVSLKIVCKDSRL